MNCAECSNPCKNRTPATRCRDYWPASFHDHRSDYARRLRLLEECKPVKYGPVDYPYRMEAEFNRLLDEAAQNGFALLNTMPEKEFTAMRLALRDYRNKICAPFQPRQAPQTPRDYMRTWKEGR
jgi:hypothetical protein